MTHQQPTQYRSPDGLPVDIAIFTITSHAKQGNYKMLADRRLDVLLVRRSASSEAYPSYWALPGGFSKEGETLLEAAYRELKEETNVDRNVMIEQIKTVYYPGRDPRGWMPSVLYCTLVKEAYLLKLAADTDADEVRLFPLEEALKMKLAFDHNELLQDALTYVQTKMMTTTIAKQFLPEEFTIRELYQIIKTVVPSFEEDIANFKRNLLTTKARQGLIREAVTADGQPKTTDRNSNRPAQLYVYTDYEPRISIYNSGLF
ncbi:ADP-ribose pyrophosphatase YjhB (NUDIX family) [Paenibacillus cellulosilyticus]|uniref:ADP-ribose pyrophosphatase YjhB (NUDIX family) n=1 Tax=Paenibacillus cellulosilyticus TaxID=375489 RepID=A0A2V2YQA1_9BACL|nr:NUDIX domain-containing protein [Paenibacillus cellulosilyticus]PWV98628.1 ADP-ribose pyrophosphatase YjhB (NUDIX family) [Paenibacillus cellulosilyticus]QKS43855.1 NUDIX hydrolase [Paenibacillus cellulosilyticus]